jgi:PAS domain S-box-containing protein
VLAGPEHIYEYVNQAYVEISGRTDFVGHSVREMFPELAGQGFYELLDQVYASGKSIVTRGLELRLRGADKVQYIDFVYEPIRNDRGDVAGIFVGGYEVTEAHRANAALRASESRLRELNVELERRVIERTQARGVTWQVSPDLMGALNSKGYFETSNPAWNSVLGWSEEEVASMSIFEMLHPDDVERTRVGFELTQQGQPAIRFPNPLPLQGRRISLDFLGRRPRRGHGLLQRSRHHRRKGRRGRTRHSAGGVASVAENGGDRPIDRRHRP